MELIALVVVVVFISFTFAKAILGHLSLLPQQHRGEGGETMEHIENLEKVVGNAVDNIWSQSMGLFLPELRHDRQKQQSEDQQHPLTRQDSVSPHVDQERSGGEFSAQQHHHQVPDSQTHIGLMESMPSLGQHADQQNHGEQPLQLGLLESIRQWDQWVADDVAHHPEDSGNEGHFNAAILATAHRQHEDREEDLHQEYEEEEFGAGAADSTETHWTEQLRMRSKQSRPGDAGPPEFIQRLMSSSKEELKSRTTIQEHIIKQELEREKLLLQRMNTEIEVPHCVDEMGYDPDAPIDALRFEKEWSELCSQRIAQRTHDSAQLLARKEAREREKKLQHEIGRREQRDEKKRLGEVKDEFNAYVSMQKKFQIKLKQVQSDAGMVLHAMLHRPSPQDYAGYLHNRNHHYMRDNFKAACHATRFVRAEDELEKLQRQAIIKILKSDRL